MQVCTRTTLLSSTTTCSCARPTNLALYHQLRSASTSSSSPSSASASSSKSRRRASSAGPPSANTLPFSAALQTLRSLSPGDTSSAYELTLLPRLAASVNVNSLRGRSFLEHDASNTKKKELILVFAEGEKAEEARREGGSEVIVGGKEFIDEILQSRIQPTKIISTPDFLSLISRSGLPRILGPKGLMPSAKRGTVTDEISRAIREVKGGLDWLGIERTSKKLSKDKNSAGRGLVSVPIGRIGFDETMLEQNVRQFVREVLDVCNGKGTQAEVSAAPGSSSGGAKKKAAEIEKMYLSTSRGISVQIQDAQRLVQQA